MLEHLGFTSTSSPTAPTRWRPRPDAVPGDPHGLPAPRPGRLPGDRARSAAGRAPAGTPRSSRSPRRPRPGRPAAVPRGRHGRLPRQAARPRLAAARRGAGLRWARTRSPPTAAEVRLDAEATVPGDRPHDRVLDPLIVAPARSSSGARPVRTSWVSSPSCSSRTPAIASPRAARGPRRHDHAAVPWRPTPWAAPAPTSARPSSPACASLAWRRTASTGDLRPGRRAARRDRRGAAPGRRSRSSSGRRRRSRRHEDPGRGRRPDLHA